MQDFTQKISPPIYQFKKINLELVSGFEDAGFKRVSESKIVVVKEHLKAIRAKKLTLNLVIQPPIIHLL